MDVVHKTVERPHNPFRRLPVQSKHGHEYGCEYGCEYGWFLFVTGSVHARNSTDGIDRMNKDGCAKRVVPLFCPRIPELQAMS